MLDTDSIDSIINDLKNHDFVFIALHGTFGEDGVIQSILSKNNIPFNGSDEDSSRNCFNKSVTKEIVMNQGILSPSYYQTSSNTCNDHFDFNSEKYIVKPNSQGSSVGFNIVNKLEDLQFKLIKKIRLDGIKGIKDEISFLQPIFRYIYNSNNIFFKILSKIINKLFSNFTNHITLLIVQKK